MISRSAFGNATFGANVVEVVLSTAKALPAARAAMTKASITGTMMRLITHPLSQVRGVEAFSHRYSAPQGRSGKPLIVGRPQGMMGPHGPHPTTDDRRRPRSR